MPMIPIDLIAIPEDNVRQHAAPPADEEGLKASIAALGMLTPLLLRPNGNSGYILVTGHRRLRAARELGLQQVPAHVENGFAPQNVLLAQAAENMVRAGMAPVDQWRAIVEMQRNGWTLAASAACLGLSERQARKLDKLGRLHHDVLARIEQGDMPDEDELGHIAIAPPDVQARALKAAGNDEDGTDWYKVCSGCSVDHIPRGHAIFDVDASDVVFEEDLFAEPDRDGWFTTDVARFLSAQREALKADVAKQKGEKRRIEYAEADKHNSPKLPKGWVASYTDPDKPKRDETVFCCVASAGYDIGKITRLAAKKAAVDPKKGKSADRGGDDEGADQDTDEQPTPADTRPARKPGAAGPTAETTSRDPISKAGQSLLANAKTIALHKRLEEAQATISPERLLALMVLALCARTVTVTSGSTGYARVNMQDLATRLIPPEGAAGLQVEMAHGVAIEALTRMLVVSLPDQAADPVPEWIGHAIGAETALPRFDTEGFLAHVGGAELKRQAIAAGEKPAKTVDGLRAQLVGKLDQWRPASFGAPGPKATS